jgi:hypothetical protein
MELARAGIHDLPCSVCDEPDPRKCQACDVEIVRGPTARDVDRFDRYICGACEYSSAEASRWC